MDQKTQSVLTLCTGRLEPGRYNWSAFVNKLDTRLRFAGLKYDLEAGSLSEGPKGKIPYVKFPVSETSPDPSMLGDSTLIIKHLVEIGFVDDLNKDLSPPERTHDLALKSLLEDKVYFYQGWERWMVPANFYLIRDIGPLAPLPYPLRIIVGILAYRKNLTMLHGQGTGRYTPAELDALRDEAWSAINDLVRASQTSSPRTTRAQDKTRRKVTWAFGGDSPTEFDATLFGFLAATLICPANPNAQATIRRLPALMRYASEVHDAYFPDYEKWDE